MIAGCIPQVGNVETVLHTLGRDIAEPTSAKLLFQINKPTNRLKISQFVLLDREWLWQFKIPDVFLYSEIYGSAQISLH